MRRYIIAYPPRKVHKNFTDYIDIANIFTIFTKLKVIFWHYAVFALFAPTSCENHREWQSAIGCTTNIMQLNTFFISFPFFSSQFSGIIKVQRTTPLPGRTIGPISEFNTNLFHFFLSSSYAIPADRKTPICGFCYPGRAWILLRDWECVCNCYASRNRPERQCLHPFRARVHR